MNAPATVSRRSNLDAALLARTAPLPISSYFDPGWFKREMQLLFDKGPNYVGSERMVPEAGDARRDPPRDAAAPASLDGRYAAGGAVRLR